MICKSSSAKKQYTTSNDDDWETEKERKSGRASIVRRNMNGRNESDVIKLSNHN
jgi:hypothetical protein